MLLSGDSLDGRSEQFVVAADVAIIGAAADGTIVFANPFAEALFGYGAGELLGCPVEILVPEMVGERHRGHRERAPDTTRAMGNGRVLVAARKDGSVFPVEIALGVAQTTGGPVHQAIIIDVSLREAANKALVVQFERQAALASLGRIGLTASAQVVMDQAVGVVADSLHADLVAICELSRNEALLHPRARAGTCAARLGNQGFSAAPDSAGGHALASDAPALDADVLRAGLFEGSLQQQLGFASGVALRVEGWGVRAYGLLQVHFLTEHTFSGDEIAFLRSISSILAVAIDRAHREPLFDLSADMLAVGAADDGFLVRVNPACATTLGWTQEELCARPAVEFVHPDDRVLFEDANAGARGTIAEVRDLETRFRTKSGDYCHLLASARTSVDGRWIYIVAKDITERRDRETALAQSAAENELILQSAGVGIYRTDADGTITYINAATARLLGWGEEELIGRNAHATLHHSRPDGSAYPVDECPSRNVMSTDAIVRVVDEVYWRADGSSFPVEYTAAPVRDAAGIAGVVIVFSDVTARKQIEAEAELKRSAEQANRAKSEFLSRMSHELRTPLNAILGFGQLLERSDLGEREQRYAGHILTGGHHLLALIDEVLEISRIEAGDLGVSREPVLVAPAVREVIDLMAPLAQQHEIDVHLDLGAFDQAYVLADVKRIKQVLLNLLSNAVKYNSKGGSMGLAASAEGDMLVLSVTDTGAGIEADKLPRLFSPFDRLGAEASSIEGTGLGLALSQRLTEAMGGSLRATSQVGVGSTFELRLQLTPAPAAPVAARRLDAISKTSPLACRVLYIADNISNIRLIEEVLADDAIEVITANTGHLGVETAVRARPDVILLDLHLPDMQGWDVFTALRARLESRSIPVVVLTADPTDAQRRRMLELGAAAHLTKPIDVAGLRTTIASALSQAGSQS